MITMAKSLQQNSPLDNNCMNKIEEEEISHKFAHDSIDNQADSEKSVEKDQQSIENSPDQSNPLGHSFVENELQPADKENPKILNNANEVIVVVHEDDDIPIPTTDNPPEFTVEEDNVKCKTSDSNSAEGKSIPCEKFPTQQVTNKMDEKHENNSGTADKLNKSNIYDNEKPTGSKPTNQIPETYARHKKTATEKDRTRAIRGTSKVKKPQKMYKAYKKSYDKYNEKNIEKAYEGKNGKPFVPECVYYRRGYCRNRDACKFVHGRNLTMGMQYAIEIMLGNKVQRDFFKNSVGIAYAKSTKITRSSRSRSPTPRHKKTLKRSRKSRKNRYRSSSSESNKSYGSSSTYSQRSKSRSRSPYSKKISQIKKRFRRRKRSSSLSSYSSVSDIGNIRWDSDLERRILELNCSKTNDNIENFDNEKQPKEEAAFEGFPMNKKMTGTPNGSISAQPPNGSYAQKCNLSDSLANTPSSSNSVDLCVFEIVDANVEPSDTTTTDKQQDNVPVTIISEKVAMQKIVNPPPISVSQSTTMPTEPIKTVQSAVVSLRTAPIRPPIQAPPSVPDRHLSQFPGPTIGGPWNRKFHYVELQHCLKQKDMTECYFFTKNRCCLYADKCFKVHWDSDSRKLWPCAGSHKFLTS